MDILTLELFDVTVSHALTEVSHALEQHPDLPIRVMLDGDEMVLHNVLRFLERQERKVTSSQIGSHWQLEIPTSRPTPHPSRPTPVLHPLPAPVLSAPATPTITPRPVLLLRSAFTPGDRALGRRLLLGLLNAIQPPVPWLGLAHDALDLLDDPTALADLEKLRTRGIAVRLSRESLEFQQRSAEPFEILDDREWQDLAAQGKITLL